MNRRHASTGKRIRIAYDLTVEGKLILSINSNKPLRYVQGKKEILPNLEKALKGLKPGEKKTVRLLPRDGYGLENPGSIM